MVGYRDMNLYNTLYEGLSLKRDLGIEVEFFEMLEMLRRSENIPRQQIGQIHQKILHEWEFDGQPDDDTLQKGISYYLAIRELAAERDLKAISLKDVDGMKKLLGFPPAMIFMLLADDGMCVIPENDVMGSVTQLIVKNLTGQAAPYLEFYEFFEESVLMGVPDFIPAEAVDGKVRVKPAAFGDLSGGILNVSTMKTGRLTLARLSNTADSYSMHITTGEGKHRSWEEAGWDQPAPQLPSLEILLDTPVEEFAQKVSGQHYIIAYGDHSDRLMDFCRLKNIPMA
jgi:L-fucose isomerase-like protein